MIKSAAVVLAGLLLLAPGFAAADGSDHSLEELVVEMAETPSQHKALAAHFRAKAESAREEGRSHKRMGKSYRQGKATQRAAMKRHCDEIAEQNVALAAEYEALAELHESHADGK